MANRATFTLDDEAFAFLTTFGGKNKSAFVNRLLNRERQMHLKKEVLAANLEESADAAYQQELAEWDVTLLDGTDQ